MLKVVLLFLRPFPLPPFLPFLVSLIDLLLLLLLLISFAHDGAPFLLPPLAKV